MNVLKGPILNEEKASIFHSIAAKMLFITKRGRPDLEPTVQFMCTRVTKSTEQDWIKMRRLMLFLKNIINERRYIAIKDKGAMFTWVDAAYAVYEDMRSQTGDAISFGLGVVHCKSLRQKLNTKSSTESEVVGVSDYLPYNIWMTLFLKEQGMILYKNVLYQDNQIAMKMLKHVPIVSSNEPGLTRQLVRLRKRLHAIHTGTVYMADMHPCPQHA